MQVLILAGGLGTRLRSVVSDRPKPMADINGKPFLDYLVNKLVNNGYKDVILAVGYKNEVIKNYFKDGKNFNCKISYAIEETPLGTGGAIANAIELIYGDIMVLNGDTYFDLDFNEFENFHRNKNSYYSIALRKVIDVTRYGAVEFDKDNKILKFIEKGHESNSTYINGGIYIINKEILKLIEKGKRISLENDIIPYIVDNEGMYGFKSEGYFIDIGIPDDYKRFCCDVKGKGI